MNYGKLKPTNHHSLITNHCGFTLIELLIGIVIIGILAISLISVLNPLEQIKKTRDSQRKHDFDQLRKALEIYFIDNGSIYPLALALNGGRGISVGNDTAIQGYIDGNDWGNPWLPYIAKLPKDPLDSQPYLYRVANNRTWYRLYAKLENCKDPQKIPEAECTNYNYSVTSPNIAVAPLLFEAQPIRPPEPPPVQAQITIALNNKHNFISLPVTPPDTNVETIISDIASKVSIIWYYVTAEDKFIDYAPGFPSDLTTLEPGKGYRVRMKTIDNVVQTANLQIAGIPYEFQPITLEAAKFHMIGAPYTDVKLVDVIGTCSLAGIELFTINGDSGANESITVDTNTVLSSGKGYWITSSAACTLKYIPPTPTPTLAPYRRVFVTSTTYNGNLGRLAGGDEKCQARADAANLGYTWKAWLSAFTQINAVFTQINAVDRIYPPGAGKDNTEYKLVDGETVVANNKTGLIDGTIDHAIDRDENNSLVSGAGVWTGTSSNGNYSGASCNAWFDGRDSIGGSYGTTDMTDSRWTIQASGHGGCATLLRLYCFEE